MTVGLRIARQVIGNCSIFAGRLPNRTGRPVSTVSAIKQGIRRSARESRDPPSSFKPREGRFQYSRNDTHASSGQKFNKYAEHRKSTSPQLSQPIGSSRGRFRSSDDRARPSERPPYGRNNDKHIEGGSRLRYNERKSDSRAGTRQRFGGGTSASYSSQDSNHRSQDYDRAATSRDSSRFERGSGGYKAISERRSYEKDDYGGRNVNTPRKSNHKTGILDYASPKERPRITSFGDEEDYGHGRDDQDIDRGARLSSKTPGPRKTRLSIPYTTPASQFLYGTSVVIAALHSKRRKLYKLYLYSGDDRSSVPDASLRRLARARGIETIIIKSDGLSLMDRMSGGRPHNGSVLEASPLAKMPITGLAPVEKVQGALYVIPDHQSREDEDINGKVNNVKYTVGFPRYPFLLMLDGVLDPGNLGGILRTAYFLGVDAVVISTLSAPLSPVTLKASAGAAESLPLFSVQQTGTFIQSSQEAGWKFFAAVAPPKGRALDAPRAQEHFFTTSIKRPLTEHPCVLMLGGEGTGLKPDLQRKADYLISIDGHRSGQGGVDSLNVSVAAGLLSESFLRKSQSSPKKRSDEQLELIDGKTENQGELF